MLKNGHLIKIKEIPHVMEQTVLHFFLRRYSSAFDPHLGDGSWLSLEWYREGCDFIIVETPRSRQWYDYGGEDCFGFQTVWCRGKFTMTPDILLGFLEKPMLLKMDMYNLSPADLDQMDIINSLRTCRVLGNFITADVRNQPKRFGIMVDNQQRMVLVRLLPSGGNQPIWYFPAEETKEFVW